jgi:hypothetical protein
MGAQFHASLDEVQEAATQLGVHIFQSSISEITGWISIKFGI